MQTKKKKIVLETWDQFYEFESNLQPAYKKKFIEQVTKSSLRFFVNLYPPEFYFPLNPHLNGEKKLIYGRVSFKLCFFLIP